MFWGVLFSLFFYFDWVEHNGGWVAMEEINRSPKKLKKVVLKTLKNHFYDVLRGSYLHPFFILTGWSPVLGGKRWRKNIKTTVATK